MDHKDAHKTLEKAAIQLSLVAVKLDDQSDVDVLTNVIQILVDFAGLVGCADGGDVKLRDAAAAPVAQGVNPWPATTDSFAWRKRFSNN